jgi:class 3 adenylate cyclase
MLAAVMFTDAVAFSSHVGRDEEVALREIEEDFEVMRAFAAQHRGQVLKSMGDGMLIVFPSAQNAVTCALEIQRRLGQKTWNHDRNPLLHRIGIHLCDVLLTEDDVHGDGVNLASRLERECAPGGIAMSQATYDVVRGKLPVRANFLGERYLRNIVEPVRIWEIPPVFAPRPDQIEEAQTPRGEWRQKAQATPSNLPIVGALVFAGICLLVAAGIFAVKFVAPPPGAASSVDAPVPEEPVAQKQPNEPPVTQSAPPRASKADAGIEDPDDVASAFTPAQEEAKNEYQAAAENAKSTYDFGSLIRWIGQQGWAQEQAGKIASAHWGRIQTFWEALTSGLAQKTPAEPLQFSHGGGVARIWPLPEGRYGVLWPTGAQEVVDLRSLPPLTILEISLALWPEPTAEIAAGRRSFEREFGLRP